MKYTNKHEALMSKTGKTLQEAQALSGEEKSRFIAGNLISYICGDGTAEEEKLADDLITMITSWKVGQTEG